MGRSLNRDELIGNLGGDPDHRQTQAGNSVYNFSVATTDVYNDKGGNRQESTEWHKVVVWGPLADTCAQYLKKGSRVYIAGKLQTRKWEKDGQDRYVTEIIGRDMIMLDSRQESGRGNNSVSNPSSGGSYGPPPGLDDDDIPF